jgi:hypothetical protein
MSKVLYEDEDNDDRPYDYFTFSHKKETYFVDYLYTKDPLTFDILTIDNLTRRTSGDFEILQEVADKIDYKILKRITKTRIY